MKSQAARTIGIDLAAQRANTAACVLSWNAGRAGIEVLARSFTDDDLVKLIEDHEPEKVAIDAPFGWPRAFVASVAEYGATGEWPSDEIAPLRLRDTDRVVIAETGQQPLSVSTDRIAVTAMRCARLLTRLRGAGHHVSRDGAGLAVEVYPAAALRLWTFNATGYKGRALGATAKRLELVAQVLSACDGWLDEADDCVERLAASDHHLDAFLCAVLARMVVRGLSQPVPPENRQAAAVEGWIQLPVRDALERLATTTGVA
jgi:hypothetical protein